MTRIAFLIAALWIISFSAEAQSSCVLKKDQDSIKVFACDNGKQQFKSIQASFQAKATLSEIAAVLMDVENYPAWQFRTIEAKILKRLNDHEFIYYIQVSAPWPISNRDLVVHFLISQDPQNKVITVTANGVPDFIPKVDGLVRVPSSTSRWIITALDKHDLMINYSIQIDPGGSVPVWMANLVAADAPYESFRNLKARIKKRKLEHIRAPFIVD